MIGLPTISDVCTGVFGFAAHSLGEPDRFFQIDKAGIPLRSSRTTFVGHTGFSIDWHYGVDWRAPAGAAFRAVEDGVVERVWQYTNSVGVNYAITIRHTPRFRWTFLHCLASSRLKVGTKVVKGQTVATSGKSGTLAYHAHGTGELLDDDGVWREYNPERLMVGHRRKIDHSDGSVTYISVPAGDMAHDPRITIMLGKVAPTVPKVNIREKPTSASTDLGDLLSGQSLPYDKVVVGEVVLGNSGWYEVEIPGLKWGYVSDAYANPV